MAPESRPCGNPETGSKARLAPSKFKMGNDSASFKSLFHEKKAQPENRHTCLPLTFFKWRNMSYRPLHTHRKPGI
jgi:hypothetical protein